MDSEWIGKWVAVRYSYTHSFGFAGTMDSQYAYGILDSMDEASLLVRQPGGETVYIPRSAVRAFELIEPPELGPAGTMLRASDLGLPVEELSESPEPTKDSDRRGR